MEMATEKQVKYVQSLQSQYNIEKYTKEQISNMSHQEIIDVVKESLILEDLETSKQKIQETYKVKDGVTEFNQKNIYIF